MSFTDDNILELWEYYATEGMTKILESDREPSRKPKRVDQLLCACGQQQTIDEGSLMCTACRSRQLMHVNKMPGECVWMKEKTRHI